MNVSRDSPHYRTGNEVHFPTSLIIRSEGKKMNEDLQSSEEQKKGFNMKIEFPFPDVSPSKESLQKLNEKAAMIQMELFRALEIMKISKMKK